MSLIDDKELTVKLVLLHWFRGIRAEEVVDRTLRAPSTHLSNKQVSCPQPLHFEKILFWPK